MSRPNMPAHRVSSSEMFKALFRENPSVITGIIGGMGMFLHQIRNYEVNRGRMETFADYTIRSRVLVCATVVGCIVIEGGIKSAHHFYLKFQGKPTYDHHESRRKRMNEELSS